MSASPLPKPILSPGALLFLRIWLGVITIITVVMVVLAVRELVDPASDGVAGSVVITHCDVANGSRRCYGDFTGGGLTLSDTQVFGEDHGSVGAHLSGYGDADQHTISVVGAAESFTDVYVAVVFLLVWAGMAYALVYRPLRRRAARRG